MNIFDISRLSEVVKDFSKSTILVLGDLMLDRYLWGQVNRISPEAPVPVVAVNKETSCLGGAGNVSRNLQSLGASVLLAGQVGDDDAGRWIKSNAPFGEPLHWSRPFDVLLLAGAIPLSVFVDFETALFAWGVVLSPVLLIFALIELNWATRVILSKDGTFLVILIFLFMPTILTYFQAGVSD